MRSLLLLAIISTAIAQPTLTLKRTDAGPVYPSAILTFELDLTGSAGAAISAFGGIGLPAGISNISQGSASVAAQKILTCTTESCIESGNPTAPSNVPYSDGQILTFSYAVPVGPQIILAGLWNPPTEAVDVSGNPVALSAGPAVSIAVSAYNPACTVKAQALLTSIGTAAIANWPPLLGQLVLLLQDMKINGTC